MNSVNSDIRFRRSDRSLQVLLGVALVAFSAAFALSFFPFNVSAHEATLDAASTVTVDPGQSIAVSITAHITGIPHSDPNSNHELNTIQYGFKKDGVTTIIECKDVEDGNPHNGDHEDFVRNFSINAPTDAGTYDFWFKVSASDDCLSQIGSEQLMSGAITVNAPLVCPEGYTGTYPDCVPPPPSCSGEVPTTGLLVDTNQAVSNNPDSGFHGDWALDAFTKHMRVWAEGDHFCGQTDDSGTFVTTGPNSPGIPGETTLALDAGINGTFSGGARYVIHGTFAPVWPVSGDVPPKNDGVGGGYSSWVAQYFSSETHDFYYWHWTYTSCGHGSWTNSDSLPGESDGDIVTGPTEESCVVPPPTCTSTQHLDVEHNVCVENPSITGGGNGSGNNDGGTVLGLIGTVNTNPTGGQVLGASTDLPASCTPYLDGYFKKGSSNMEQIKKLQTFLNQNLGLSIPVTGIFGPLTFDAVSKFQVKYADEILKPWFDKGLSKDMNPSGYVYKTTLRMINMLQCSTLEIPVPQLP